MKKKIIPLLSMLLFIYLFALCGTSYAVVLDNNIVKEYANIMYTQNRTNNQAMAKSLYDLLQSSEFNESGIDFSNTEQLRIVIRKGNDINLNYTRDIIIIELPSETSITILSNSQFKFNSNVNGYRHKFTISYSQSTINSITYEELGTYSYNTNAITNNDSTTINYLLIDNVTNTNNYTYYGWNEYYQILTRGNSATVTTSNQPYPIADAYVGNVYSNLDYEVYYFSNGQKIYYNGQVTTYTTPTNNGNNIAIAVNEARNS